MGFKHSKQQHQPKSTSQNSSSSLANYLFSPSNSTLKSQAAERSFYESIKTYFGFKSKFGSSTSATDESSAKFEGGKIEQKEENDGKSLEKSEFFEEDKSGGGGKEKRGSGRKLRVVFFNAKSCGRIKEGRVFFRWSFDGFEKKARMERGEKEGEFVVDVDLNVDLGKNDGYFECFFEVDGEVEISENMGKVYDKRLKQYNNVYYLINAENNSDSNPKTSRCNNKTTINQDNTPHIQSKTTPSSEDKTTVTNSSNQIDRIPHKKKTSKCPTAFSKPQETAEDSKKTYGNFYPLKENLASSPPLIPKCFDCGFNEKNRATDKFGERDKYLRRNVGIKSDCYKALDIPLPHIYFNHLMTEEENHSENQQNNKENAYDFNKNRIKNEDKGYNECKLRKIYKRPANNLIKLNTCIRNRCKHLTIVMYKA